MRVVVLCERSQVVTKAFRARGFEAYSCDILGEYGGRPEWHIKGDARDVMNDGWGLIIAHPECTYLCSSGMHWTTRGFRDPQLTEDALQFVRDIMAADCPHIAIENPIGRISTRIRKPDQIVQPYEYGDDASKATCLWLKNLPLLVGTLEVKPRIVNGKKRWGNQTPGGHNKLGPSADRHTLRSQTYQGIAGAMAEQWGIFLQQLNDLL